MTNRPVLLLPAAAPAARANFRGGSSGPPQLDATQQQRRLGQRLRDISAAFEERRISMQTSVAGIVPEDVLVLETAGTVEEFVRAVRRVSGIEFLGEHDEDVLPDDDFFVDRDGVREGFTGRVYFMFTSQGAFQEMLRLWDRWQADERPEHGFARWRDVFSRLRDIRPWGVKDRLEETGVLTDWTERATRNEEHVPVEIELWYRSSVPRRQRASALVRSLVEELGGQIASEAVVGQIHYHAMAAKLPLAAVEHLLDATARGAVELVNCEQIQFFRAAGQAAARMEVNPTPSMRQLESSAPTGEPVVALLDALPLQNHRALDGRLIIDDPDGFEADYPANTRHHGTAMASIVVWGDLNDTTATAAQQPVYVRPIMRPVFPPAWTEMDAYEQVPDTALMVDLVHRAVRRALAGDGREPPAAPSVRVVSLSVGISDRPFIDTLSPLARLVDWLAWEYGLLFVVSAGNHLSRIETGMPWTALEELSAEDRASVVLRAIVSDTRNRRVLSPAEAMNALTVGGAHSDSDSSVAPGDIHLDLLPSGYPSTYTAHGLGYRRTVKPDVLAPAGRIQFRRPLLGTESHLLPIISTRLPGVQVACPGSAGDLGSTVKTRGTSNAAALVSRAAASLHASVEQLRRDEGGASLASVPDGVLLKALVAHRANWGATSAALRTSLAGVSGDLEYHLTRLIGFGTLDPSRGVDCSAVRVTAVGGGLLRKNGGAEHRLPLPPSLSGRQTWRRLTVTLAWFSPVNPLSYRWRKAALWFENPKSKLRTARVGPPWQAARRGTLQHDVFEGEAAVAFVEGDDVVIKVSCREDAPGLEEQVPYALAVTLEVADAFGADIYTEIRERIRQRLHARVRS